MTHATRRRFWSGIPKPNPLDKMALGEWTRTKSDFCARILENKSVLKILLKTKNDHHFLESWIQHHAKIVGLNNLIIFDNMSSNLKVLNTYQTYYSQIPIVQFAANHNNLHEPALVPELYECLRQACEFYAFLDTDEFLVLLNGRTYTCDEEILEFLQAHEGIDVFPASSLTNAVGSDKRFFIGKSLYDFGHHLAWGKPVIRSRLQVNGYVNHNILLDKSLFGNVVVPNMCLLHLPRLFSEQRIATTINKLVAMDFASPEDTIETILMKDVDAVADGNLRLTVRLRLDELAELAKRSSAVDTPCVALDKHCIELGERGEILYPGESEFEALDTFLTHGQPFIHAVLHTDVWELRTSSFQQLQHKWQEAATACQYERMVCAVKRIAEVQLPLGVPVAVISKGDPDLLDIGGRQVTHFPADDTGVYAGCYPTDDGEAVALVDALLANGTEFLIIPSTAFWWLDYYHALRDRLGSCSTRIWQSAECAIYRLSARQTGVEPGTAGEVRSAAQELRRDA